MENKQINYNTIRKSFEALKLKVTHQRVAIYEYLLNCNEHPSAEETYNKVKRKFPSISLGTVYKTLETFVNSGLLNKVKTHEDKIRFDSNLEKHDHIYCIKTKKLIDFEDGDLKIMIEKYLNQRKLKNFRINDIQLQIIGEIINPDKEIRIS